MSGENRKFGFLWYETADNAYKSGADFFEQGTAEQVRRHLWSRVSFGFPRRGPGPGAGPPDHPG